MALTNKQRKFILEYPKDCNATAAAARAGYSGSRQTLAVAGHRLMHNPEVRERIDAYFSAKAMTAGEALQHLAEIVRDDATPVRERISAIDKVLRVTDQYTDHVEVEHSGGVTLDTFVKAKQSLEGEAE